MTDSTTSQMRRISLAPASGKATARRRLTIESKETPRMKHSYEPRFSSRSHMAAIAMLHLIWACCDSVRESLGPF